jgi:coproporphyrinogen III oxidase-like Fe-S oxidoreductase
LPAGVPIALFVERTGYPFTLVQKGLDAAEQRGLIERDHLQLRPTALGRRFLNDLQALFLPSARKVAHTTGGSMVMERPLP